jgi:hypothetical protein
LEGWRPPASFVLTAGVESWSGSSGATPSEARKASSGELAWVPGHAARAGEGWRRIAATTNDSATMTNGIRLALMIFSFVMRG